MTKVQIDQYDMLLSVENHFDDNNIVWASNVPLAAAKTLLSNKIELLAEQIAIQLLNRAGLTIEKAELRGSLQAKGFIICSAISAYAAATGNTDLYKLVNINKSTFEKFRDAELLGVITNVHREGTAQISNLTSYGITTTALVDLLDTNNAFGAMMKNPESAIAKRKSATDAIANMLPEIVEIVATRMDNLMVGLEAAQPQFVSIYNTVRIQNGSPTYKLSATVTTIDAASNAPIAKVDLQVISAGISRMSGERGYNKIQNLAAGAHVLEAKHPNYVTKTINFTVVSGETTEILVELVAKE